MDQWADWAHHLQFSEHFPLRALRIAQKSKWSALNASVTRCAASKRSSLRPFLRTANSSSAVTSPPPMTRLANAAAVNGLFLAVLSWRVSWGYWLFKNRTQPGQQLVNMG